MNLSEKYGSYTRTKPTMKIFNGRRSPKIFYLSRPIKNVIKHTHIYTLNRCIIFIINN